MFDMEKNCMASMDESKFSTPASMDMDCMAENKFSTPASMDMNGMASMAESELTLPSDPESNISNELQKVEGAVNETETFAPNMEVQAELIREAFLNIPEVQYENWKEMTVEERVAAMNELEKCAAEIAHRDPITVRSEDLEYPTMGYYNNQEKVMVISEFSVGDSSYEAYVRAMTDLFHEGRHAYQDYNLDVCRVEQNDERVFAWQMNDEILGYDSGHRLIFKTYGMLRHATQPVEVDARVFAETVIQELEL